MKMIVDKLRIQQYSDSTRRSYLSAWRSFNEFFIKLDRKPNCWEDHLVLFVGYLVELKRQSSTIKSYISAIKAVLREDGIELCENRFLINTLTKTCKIRNDKVCTRLPIQKGLLKVIIKYIGIMHYDQPCLEALYKALFTSAYFGLCRVGELTTGSHPILATDIHVGGNKNKFKLILRSSKTHTRGDKPQIIKVESDPLSSQLQTRNDPLCPYTALKNYLKVRRSCVHINEPFFIFRDRTPVAPTHMRKVLKEALSRANLDPDYYGVHSICMGRACDLVHVYKFSLETVKKIGRWRSNAVFEYLAYAQ